MTRHLATGGRAVAGLPGRHVLIVGGGASGVLMAAHLLGRDATTRVTIVEAAHLLGCGIAYSTRDPEHLLNTRVHNMSAFPDDPAHFHRWLQGRPEGAAVTPQCFVGRAVYGAYLSDLLRPWSGGAAAHRLTCLTGRVVALRETVGGLDAVLEDGRRLQAKAAILATGHALPPPDPGGLLAGAWSGGGAVDPEARVVIVGSGLSMVDQVLSLLTAGHRGPIVTLSRRGLLPRVHAPTTPLPVPASEIPFGAPLSAMLRCLRRLARQAEAGGGTWRDAVDGLRPHAITIWQALPMAERARFLRHGVAWWDIHRHRIPAVSASRIVAALASGQLRTLRGTFLGAEPGAEGMAVAVYRPHGQTGTASLPGGRIIDCRGIRHDPETAASPLVADLLARGRARVDPLRIGIEVDGQCRLVDVAGRPSARIFAIGPVSRAAFWEITAIPDIRHQAAALADRLAQVGAPA